MAPDCLSPPMSEANGRAFWPLFGQFSERHKLWIPGASPAFPAPRSAQGEGLGTLGTRIDRPGHSYGAGASEWVRQRGHRAWLPGSWPGSWILTLDTRSTAAFRRRRWRRLLPVTEGKDARRLTSLSPLLAFRTAEQTPAPAPSPRHFAISAISNFSGRGLLKKQQF